MKVKIFILLIISVLSHFTYAQMERINQTINPLEAQSHLRFLTSDELKGRDTGSDELIIAGRYIAEQFRRYGLQPLGDKPDDYLQAVPLRSALPATQATVDMIGSQFKLSKDLVIVSATNVDVTADVIFLENLLDYQTEDVTGKVIVTVLADYSLFNTPLADIQKAGAVGLIQLYRPGWKYPWPLMVNYLSNERMSVGSKADAPDPIPHVWINDTARTYVEQLANEAEPTVSIAIKGIEEKQIKSFNIIGKVEGTDPKLKAEHLIMTAHYDHIGVQRSQTSDSIYNGTRDNGIGTTAVINAARYFSQHPPKRSVIFMALTAEEKGLLGSQYYADNPKVPLQETVFNLNIDNSGYTDTEHIFLLDTSRTNIDPFAYQAVEEVGLKLIGDRIPEQNYYERSDQVSFASKGVPAVNFRMSILTFDDRIRKYYHQPGDEFESVDMEYIHKYWKAYIRTAELIGNWKKRPYWLKGDKFEQAGKALYQSNKRP